MKFGNPYLSITTRIRMLQRWVLVHSYVYYELNKNIVSDEVFDKNCRQLVKLTEQCDPCDLPLEYKNTFKDFNGATGFHLYNSLSKEQKVKIKRDAEHIVHQMELR